MASLLFSQYWINNGKLSDYKYLYVNNEYERQTGLKAAAAVGKNAKQLFSKLDPLWSEIHDNFIRTGKPTWYENYNSITKRWFNLLVFSIGKVKIGILFRDITDRKKTEERLKENQRLETAQRVAHVGYGFLSRNSKENLTYRHAKHIRKFAVNFIESEYEVCLLDRILFATLRDC